MLPNPPPTHKQALWAVGVGQYSLAINGAPVGLDTNAPGWTRWDARVLYGSFDVRALLPAPGGRFALSALLGSGFYNVGAPPGGRYTKFSAPPAGPRALLARLLVEFADGSSFSLDTSSASGAWAATDGGPIAFAHQYAGEDRNASLEEPGWDLPGWAPANPLVAWAAAANCTPAAPRGALQPQGYEGVGVAERLPAVSLNGSALAGVALVDVGRNFAGFFELTVEGVPAGAAVRVWPSETMAAGAINQNSGGSPAYVQVFTAPGNGTVNVTVRPRFFTYGWRWLAVEVLPSGAPPPRPGPAPPPSPPFNGTIAVAAATWGANCNPAVAGDLTANVEAACGGRNWCDFAVCAGPAPPCIPDPAQNCAKNFTAVFACTGDPAGAPPRAAGLPAEAAYGAPARLSCAAAPPPPPPPPPAAPSISAAAGVFTRALVPRVGTWRSSSDWVNRIHNITVEAIEANLQHVLTDCPHRERLGWLEVSHLMAPSIAFNFDISRLWRKIAFDTVDSQLASGMVPDIAPEYTVFAGGFRDSPEWGSAAVLNPYWLHVLYGDVGTLNATFPAASRYVDYLLSKREPSGLLRYGLGDWIPVEPSPPGVTATATLVQDLRALAHAASALGLPAAVAANYSALAAATGAAFQRAWGGADGATYPTQCAAGMALALGVTPPAARAAAAAALLADVRARGNVTTSGEIGNRYALLALGDAGAEGVQAVWDSLLRTSAPGYGWMLMRGETALAESWDDSPGDSHIHAMYGHVDEFLYTYVAGMRARGEGGDAWRAVEFAPFLPAGVEWVNATFDSPRGLLAVAVQRGAGSRVVATLTVPPGVEATYRSPAAGAAVRRVRAGTWAFSD